MHQNKFSLDHMGLFYYQLLLTYAGHYSNVRVERASRDCFNDGGALAEVMSLYENMAEAKAEDSEKEVGWTEHGNNHLDIEV